MTDVDDTKTVAVLGLGNMGGALAEALLSAGFSVIVWNRTTSKSVALVERGARTAQAPDITIVKGLFKALRLLTPAVFRSRHTPGS